MVLADQVTKIWAVERLTGEPSMRVLGDFFMFTLVYNEGGAMGTNFGSSLWYLSITLIVLPLLAYYTWKHRDEFSIGLPLSLILAGAIGNLIDRIRLGRVVDFIDVDFIDIEFIGLTRWWTFNIADVCISMAIVFLGWRLFFVPETREKELSIKSNETD